MKMVQLSGLAVLGITCMVTPTAGWQKQATPCADANKYESHNQIDPPALVVGAIRGRTVIEVQMTDYVKRVYDKAPGACLTLFTEEKHEPVSNVVADKKGRFRFGSIPDGDFRLIARLEGFCTANQLIHVRRSRDGRSKFKNIVVHFMPEAIDACSYIALAGKGDQ